MLSAERRQRKLVGNAVPPASLLAPRVHVDPGQRSPDGPVREPSRAGLRGPVRPGCAPSQHQVSPGLSALWADRRARAYRLASSVVDDNEPAHPKLAQWTRRRGTGMSSSACPDMVGLLVVLLTLAAVAAYVMAARAFMRGFRSWTPASSSVVDLDLASIMRGRWRWERDGPRLEQRWKAAHCSRSC